MKKLFHHILVLLLLVSCGDSGVTEPDKPPENELLKRVYDGPKWPEDIEVDPQLPNASYLGFNGPEGRMLPCVASSVEAESLATEAGFLIVGSPRETELYFEFDNERAGFGRPIIRVYRSSYIESLTFMSLFGIDWPGSGIGSIGPIVHEPLTADVVLDLFDHIWTQRNYNLWGAVLLSRQLEDREDMIILTTHEALVVGGDWDICDRISQLVTTYTVEKQTGKVSMTRFVLLEVNGRCPYGA